MKIIFSPDVLEDLEYFKKYHPELAGKIKKLLESILYTPYSGLGKPEPLKHALTGCWSRRIDREHRLVYRVTDDTLFVLACRYHYKN